MLTIIENTTFYAWKVTNKYGEVVALGLEDSCTEFNLEQLPNGRSGEKSIWDVNETMQGLKEWEEEGYVFEYQQYNLSINDLEITKC